MTPEVHEYPTGRSRLDLLVTCRSKCGDSDRVDVLKVKLWDPDGETMALRLRKGDDVYVGGSVWRTFSKAGGKRRSDHEIRAEVVARYTREVADYLMERMGGQSYGSWPAPDQNSVHDFARDATST